MEIRFPWTNFNRLLTNILLLSSVSTKKVIYTKFYLLFLFQMDGFKDFEIRRKQKFDKQINSNVIISSKGLDEGVDL